MDISSQRKSVLSLIPIPIESCRSFQKWNGKKRYLDMSALLVWDCNGKFSNFSVKVRQEVNRISKVIPVDSHLSDFKEWSQREISKLTQTINMTEPS